MNNLCSRERLVSHIESIHDAGVILNHPERCLRYVGPWHDPRIIDFTGSYFHGCGDCGHEVNAEEACQEILLFVQNYRE